MTRLPATVPPADLPGDGVPIWPAATVLIVDDRPDLQVVMMRRSATSSFVADHTVFPGGRVEDSDSDPAWDPILIGHAEGGSGLIPDTAGGSNGHRVAVSRETLEEVGMLIGTGADRLLERRGEVERGEVAFVDAVAEAGGGLDLSGIVPISRWVTPPGSNKRYDTYFFVTRPGTSLEPVADGREAVEVGWERPAEALDRWDTSELTMISPTISMLQLLSEFTSAGEVLEAARRGAGPVQARVLVDPPHGPGASWVWWPGDAGYDAAGTVATMGWMWTARSDGANSPS